MISLLTPTGDRPETFALCIKWMLEQSFGGTVQWIIVDDGKDKITTRRMVEDMRRIWKVAQSKWDIVYIQREHEGNGPESLANNILAGLARVTNDRLLIIEDDDYYHPHYLYTMNRHLENAELVGPTTLHYFHLRTMSSRIYNNRGSALCSTGLRGDTLKDRLKESCRVAIERKDRGIDGYLWRKTKEAKDSSIDNFYWKETILVIGMKGLPGREGLGVGHKAKGFISDPHGNRLKEWIGKRAAQVYFDLRREIQ